MDYWGSRGKQKHGVKKCVLVSINNRLNSFCITVMDNAFFNDLLIHMTSLALSDLEMRQLREQKQDFKSLILFSHPSAPLMSHWMFLVMYIICTAIPTVCVGHAISVGISKDPRANLYPSIF